MIQLNRNKNNKWIFQKNISSSELLVSFVETLEEQKDITNKEQIKDLLKGKEVYKGRSEKGSASTIGVRMSQACFYMLGYKNNGFFIPSSTTQMFMSNKLEYNDAFLVNLFSLQYPSPYSNTPTNFNIYIGRFLTKLLLDERINKKLYIDEFVYFLPFIEVLTEEIYEELINSILEYRTYSYEKKWMLFREVENYDEVFANCMHEINYYFIRIFGALGVFDLVQDSNHNDGKIFSFKHGNGNTYRTDAIQSKKKVSGYIQFSEKIIDKAKKLCSTYEAFKLPITQASAISKEDWIRDLYEFNMLDYINTIKNIETNERNDEDVIKYIRDMVYNSKYGSNDGKSFENSMKPVFELFRENRYAQVISGSGDTDLLCIMEDLNNTLYKINVDSKKAENRLQAINPVRLTNHIKKNGSKYCIVVAPKFSKGARTTDISGYNIVTIEAEVLANYVLKECLSNADGWSDYTTIDKIIERNLGNDITSLINQLIVDRYKLT